MTNQKRPAELLQGSEFQLKSLFLLTAFVALIIACLLPIFRKLPTDKQLRMVVFYVSSFVYLIGVIYFISSKQRALHANAGEYYGTLMLGLRARRWKKFFSGVAILGVFTIQLVIPGLQITLDFNRSWAMLLVMILCTGLFGAMLAHQLVNVCRGRFMGSVDLYENGVVYVPRFRLSPWSQVEVRPSELYKDHGQILLQVDSLFGRMKSQDVFPASPELLRYLNALAGKKTKLLDSESNVH